MMEEMLVKFKAAGYKPKTLLRLIVDSESFSNPRSGS